MPDKEDKSILHLDLDESKKQRIRKLIRDYMSDILQKRGEMDLENTIQENKDNYEGIPKKKEGPWPGAKNYFVNLTSMSCDIATIKAKRQTMGAKPMILYEAEGYNQDRDDLTERSNWLDYKLRKKIEIQDILSKVYRESCIQGTSILKIPHEHEVENVSYVETYKPTEEDYKRFKWDTRKKSGNKQREQRLEKLGSYNEETGEFIKGQELDIRKDEERTFYRDPNPYRVPLKDFYVNPEVKDLRRQKLIAEKMTQNWYDISHREQTGYYRTEAIDELKETDEYYKKDYDVYECILYADLEERGKFKRYVITYEESRECVLRAIHYPYKHGHIYYVPYYIKPRDENFYGYGYAGILKDSQELLNNAFNNVMHEASLRVNPPIAIDAQAGDAVINTQWKPGAKYPQTEKGMVKPMELKFGAEVSLKLVQLIQVFMEAQTGISRGLSGQSNPRDEDAPAAKTAMLLRESNMRVEDVIIELQKSNAEMAFQVENLINQYKPDEIEEQDFKYSEDVRYIPHGTNVSMNSDTEAKKLMNLMNLIGKVYPEIMNDPKRKYKMLRMYTNLSGGMIEQEKEDIIPSEEEAEKLQKGKIQEREKKTKLKIAQQMRKMLENESPEVVQKVKENLQGGRQPGGNERPGPRRRQ